MKSRGRQNFLVGLCIVLAVAATGLAISWLSRTLSFGRKRHYTVVFKDARGITNGVSVAMSGVDIGSVDAVGLTRGVTLSDGTKVPDNQAQMDISVDDKYVIPVGSQFVIHSPLIGSAPGLQVNPNPAGGLAIPDGSVIAGTTSPGVEDLVATAGPVLEDARPLLRDLRDLTNKTAELTVTVNKLTMKVADPKRQAELMRTIDNMAATSEKLPALIDSTQQSLNSLTRQTNTLLASLNRATASGEKVAENAEGLTRDLRATVNENRAGLKDLIRSADETASSLSLLSQNISATIGDPKIKQSLVTASENIADMSAKLNATTDDLNRLSSDPRLSENIRETVATFKETADNLKETSASIRNIAARAETIRLPGERRQRSTGTSSEPAVSPAKRAAERRLSEAGLVLNSVYDTTVSRLHVDTAYTLLSGEDRFYRIGLTDLTYGNRFDLQAGQLYGGGAAALRYGIIAGKLGVGGDLRTGPLDWRVDAFDPNHLTVNARAKANLTGDFGLLVGVENIGSGRYSDRVTFGLQLRK